MRESVLSRDLELATEVIHSVIHRPIAAQKSTVNSEKSMVSPAFDEVSTL
jgi:hypothetical protein